MWLNSDDGLTSRVFHYPLARLLDTGFCVFAREAEPLPIEFAARMAFPAILNLDSFPRV